MPTNRPFFANFLAAFRAHSSPAYKATSSPTSPSGLASSAHVSTTSSTVTSTITASNTRTIATKATSSTSQPSNTTSPSPPPNPNTSLSAATSVVAASSHKHHVSPLSRSPGVSTPHNMSLSPPGGASTPLSRGRQRRGSDSSNSSGGFIDALGPEKWYIGGRTSTGEEKFYRLGLVTGSPGRRVRSLDRLSL
jgi:hypothetical protein